MGAFRRVSLNTDPVGPAGEGGGGGLAPRKLRALPLPLLLPLETLLDLPVFFFVDFALATITHSFSVKSTASRLS